MRERQIGKSAILVVVLVLSAAGSAQSQTATVSRSRVMKVAPAGEQRRADPRQADFTTDLRPIIARMKLHEGTNLVTETPDGLRVYAVVQVTDIRVKDASGRELKRVQLKPQRAGSATQPGSSSGRITGRGDGADDDDLRCWHCYDKGGQTHCFEIKCPFITAPSSGE